MKSHLWQAAAVLTVAALLFAYWLAIPALALFVWSALPQDA